MKYQKFFKIHDNPKQLQLRMKIIEDFLNGNLDEMIDNLIATDRAEKLKGNEE